MGPGNRIEEILGKDTSGAAAQPGEREGRAVN